MGDLDGQVAVVTGAASGIGAALVDELTGRGCNVLAADQNEVGLAERAESTGCATRVVDVRDPAEAEAMVADAVQRWGGVDLAFMNAGILGVDNGGLMDIVDATELDLDRYELTRSINQDGVIYGAVAAAKAMRDSGGGGIVCTASVAGIYGWAPDPIYSITKHAVVGTVMALAPGLRQHNVTIDAICPGGVATPLVGMDAAAADGVMILAPSVVAHAMVQTALEPGSGRAITVVANREPVRQEHVFNLDVPGFLMGIF